MLRNQTATILGKLRSMPRIANGGRALSLSFKYGLTQIYDRSPGRRARRLRRLLKTQHQLDQLALAQRLKIGPAHTIPYHLESAITLRRKGLAGNRRANVSVQESRASHVCQPNPIRLTILNFSDFLILGIHHH